MVESQKSDHAIDRIALAPEEDRGLLKNFPNRCIIHLHAVVIQDSRRLFPNAFAGVLDVFLEAVLFFATALNTRLLIAICKCLDRGDIAAPLGPLLGRAPPQRCGQHGKLTFGCLPTVNTLPVELVCFRTLLLYMVWIKWSRRYRGRLFRGIES